MNSWKEAKNILCIRLDNIGDLLMTVPAIRAVKESVRGRKITLLTSSAAGKIAKYIPEIDKVLIFNAPWVKNNTSEQSLKKIITKLKKLNFDGAIIFTVYSQNSAPAALMCWEAGIPKRLAYSHENTYELLTNLVYDPEPKEIIRHEVERQLFLVAKIDASTANKKISITVPESAIKKLAKILKLKKISLKKPIIVVHPGSSSYSRMYSEKNYKKIIEVLNKEYPNYQIVLTGVKEETKIIALINLGKNVFSLIGELSIDIFAALIQKSKLLIANNSGPVHIAAAVGTPVIDLYALTNPQHTPWMVKNKVLYFQVKKQKPYYTSTVPLTKNAEKLVNPLQVIQAARKFL